MDYPSLVSFRFRFSAHLVVEMAGAAEQHQSRCIKSSAFVSLPSLNLFLHILGGLCLRERTQLKASSNWEPELRTALTSAKDII